MRFVEFLLLHLLKGEKLAVKWAKAKGVEFKKDVILLAVLIPALMVLGLLIARAGWDADTQTAGWAVSVGRMILILTGILAGFIMVSLWVKALEVAYAIVIATQATHALIQRVRPVTREEADRFLEWLRNATAWLTFLCLLFAVLPLYRDLGLCGVFTLIVLFAAAVKQAKWFKGTLLRKLAVTFAGVVLLMTVATLFSPNLSRLFNSSLGRFDQYSARKSSLLEVEKKADKSATRTDTELMAKLTNEMNTIREYSIKRNCEQFCSEEDRLKYEMLARQVERIKNGEYWVDDAKVKEKKWKIPFIGSKTEPEPKPATAAPSPPPPWSGSLPYVVKLPPPPASRLPAITYDRPNVRPAPAPPPPVSSPRQELPAAPATPVPGSDEPQTPVDDFKELEKYPDL